MIDNINYSKHISAFYGIESCFTDVTDKFIELFVKGNKVVIPEYCNFNSCFNDPVPGLIKYLKFTIDNKQFVLRENSIAKQMVYDINIYNKKVTIVYYAFLNEGSSWINILSDQLIALNNTGLLEIAEFYAHITGDEMACQYAIKIIKSIIPIAQVFISFVNRFEFPGIHLTWQLAQAKPDNLFLYFHSKGMSYNVTERRFDEKQIFQEVICKWKRVLDVFSFNQDVNKVGLAVGDLGFIWFNFWWARGKYISQCIEPEISDNRWIYETWLAKQSNNQFDYKDCFSLMDNKKSVWCDATGACARCNSIKLVDL